MLKLRLAKLSRMQRATKRCADLVLDSTHLYAAAPQGAPHFQSHAELQRTPLSSSQADVFDADVSSSCRSS